MNETQITNLTPEHKGIVAKLRYMARQYTNGSIARGGSGSRPHYLDEAADAIEELTQRATVQTGEVKPVATVAEVHMSRYTIEWTNGPLGEGTKLYTTPPTPTVPEGWRMVPESALQWLFGEVGTFECPPERYFRGKPAPFWWRSVFRELIAAAP